MERFTKRRFWKALIPAVALLAGGAQAFAGPVIYGTLSNFDAVNDTGQVCNGFEIELDGITTSDINYTFGSPYNRYGDPVKRSITGGVVLDYAATFSGGGWSTYTPFATTPITTGGHQFWTGGDPNYPLKGAGVPGDHFGLGLTGTPTNTIYRWLTGDNAGHLTVAGSNVSIPTPVFTAAPPVGNPAAPAAVQIVVPAPDPEFAGAQFGPAIWAKVFTTESRDHAVALNDLLVGNPDLSNTVETEWVLLQKNLADKLDSGQNDLLPDSKAATCRYEFYKYVGSYSAEGEALLDTPDPNNLSATVGGFIGGQNIALNLAPLPNNVPEPASATLLGLGAMAVLLRRRR
ncbi:MAG: PEP-CTERM sorting domain-containing protein [Planctomycetota bacterium]|nr:PEP-CTERM sorting domain-containing protein [Planctomycetota bacterium]